MQKKMKKSDSPLIKQAIANLHQRNSGDYETLIRQIKKRPRPMELNVPQMIAVMSTAKTLGLEWSRGTGKTTIIGHRLRILTEKMPRSTGIFVGATYKIILTRILPSLTHGLEMFGLYKDLHYFVGRRPPRSWRRSWGTAYQEPDQYDRYITFWNGMGGHMVSQEVKGDGRALNSDWLLGDEAALLSAEKLAETVFPTMRGTSTTLNHRRLSGSKMFTSSTPITPEGMWFLQLEEQAMSDPSKTNFISADCRENLHNLRPGYLEDARHDAVYDWLFQAEYLNVRPQQVRDGYYPLLNADVHAYEDFKTEYYTQVGQEVDCRGDADLEPSLPLILGTDWGASINCLTVNQHIRTIREYRTIKDFHVLGANQEIQTDLFRKFNTYYRHHPTKEIYLWYDHSGNHRTGITKLTRAQLARKQLTELGWKVTMMTVGGSNPRHGDKHTLWNMIMEEKNPRLPRYRINRHNARNTWISMSYAQAIPGNTGDIRKDKSSERKKTIARQHATDLSDANDMPIFGMFSSHIYRTTSSMPPAVTT